jgi:hypothetical protein
MTELATEFPCLCKILGAMAWLERSQAKLPTSDVCLDTADKVGGTLHHGESSERRTEVHWSPFIVGGRIMMIIRNEDDDK